MEFTVYILYSKKIEKNYIGFTENFNQRLDFHLNDSLLPLMNSKKGYKEKIKQSLVYAIEN